MAFFDELTAATASERVTFLAVPAVARGLRGEIGLPTYVAFLTEAYHHVKHTLPLLMACGAALPERLEWLRQALGRYIQEETGHQEWVLDDICACGADAESVRRGAPGQATELMVAYAYDTVRRGNPVGFLGMVFVLEGTSIRLAHGAADALQAALQLPDQAFSYLRSHGGLDQEHMVFFAALVNRLDASEDKTAVLHGARMFYRLYGDIFRGLPLTEPHRGTL